MYMKTFVEGDARAAADGRLLRRPGQGRGPTTLSAPSTRTFVELLTPVCKSYCTDYGFKICELGVQVLGGYGYCQEYPVEQYLRDEKIASIYEGTNGIQQLDLLTRKLSMKGGAPLQGPRREHHGLRRRQQGKRQAR